MEELIKSLKEVGFDYESNKEEIDKYFNYLERLRKSGVTNMYVSPTFLVHEYELNESEATSIVIVWMNNYDYLSHKFGW